jgi:antiviral helicase SLH1
MSADNAYAQWLEQLASMRQAIADLKLSDNSQDAPAYGEDIEFDDDFSATASGEDIWDVISDEYEEYSSDQLDQDSDFPADVPPYSQQWLTEKCYHVAQRSSGLDAEALKEQISAILASDSNSKIPSLIRDDFDRLTLSRRRASDDASRHCWLR